MHCGGSFQSRLSVLSKPTTFIPPSINSTTNYNPSSFPTAPTRISFPGSAASNPCRPRPVRAASAAAVKDVFVSTTSYYELLGIPETGTLIEIKRAYKQLARKYHPDMSPPGRVEEYTQKFILVQEAYETLSDPQRRVIYDQKLAGGLHLAFSARRTYCYEKATEDKDVWKNRWQSQLSELKKRSMYKNAGRETSWAARMRRQNGDDE